MVEVGGGAEEKIWDILDNAMAAVDRGENNFCSDDSTSSSMLFRFSVEGM
jgi:hypothetical protein